MKNKTSTRVAQKNIFFVLLFLPLFLLLFCKNKTIEFVRLDKRTKKEYNPEVFINAINKVEDLVVKDSLKYKINDDSIHKFIYENKFNYVLLQKKTHDWWDYYPYLEIDAIKYPINKEYIPSPGVVIACAKYKLDNNEDLIFFYYFGDYVNSTRPTPDLVVTRFEYNSKKYSVVFAGNHFEYKKEDFGEYKGSYFFLNDHGRENIDIYKYTNGRFERDITRKIVLKDSAETGIRFINWDKTYWH